MMSRKENEAYKKEHGICRDCTRKAVPGSAFCEYHLQYHRDAARKEHERRKERMASDPEYADQVRANDREKIRKLRAKHKANGICILCSSPATHGTLCEKHWRNGIERKSKHPYQILNPPHVKHNLPIPEINDKVRLDVGKIITLYNAGWLRKDIARECRCSESSVCKWIKKAERIKGVD